MNAAVRFTVYRLPALLYMGLIYHLSSGPIASTVVRAIPDYYLHAAGYAVLYLLLFRAIHSGFRPRTGRGRLWLTLGLTVLYGLGDEYHQSFVPTRDASAGDLLADGVGGVLALAAVASLPKSISAWRGSNAAGYTASSVAARAKGPMP